MSLSIDSSVFVHNDFDMHLHQVFRLLDTLTPTDINNLKISCKDGSQFDYTHRYMITWQMFC